MDYHNEIAVSMCNLFIQKEKIIMKVFIFKVYISNKLISTYEYELPGIQSACLIAESLLDISNDKFFDMVRFFEYDPDFLRTIVYRLERSVESTETVLS